MLEAGTVGDSWTNINNIGQNMFKNIEKIRENYYFSTQSDKITNTKIEALLLQNLCLRCKEDINTQRLDLLEKIITFNFLNIPIDDKETYFNLLNFKGTKEEFITSLGEIKGDSLAK